MTLSLSPRLLLQRWSADPDPQNRAQFDDAMAKIDAGAMMYVEVTASNHSDRPAAGKHGRLARCGVHGEVWWDDGTAWQSVVDLTLPRGVKAWMQHGSSDEVGGTEALVHSTTTSNYAVATFAAEAARLYRVEWDVARVDGGTGVPNGPGVLEAALLMLRYKAGTSNPTNASTLCGAASQTIFGNVNTWDSTKTVVGWINNAAAGTYTVGGFLQSEEHAGNVRLLAIGALMTLSVTDAGPAQ